MISSLSGAENINNVFSYLEAQLKLYANKLNIPMLDSLLGILEATFAEKVNELKKAIVHLKSTQDPSFNLATYFTQDPVGNAKDIANEIAAQVRAQFS